MGMRDEKESMQQWRNASQNKQACLESEVAQLTTGLTMVEEQVKQLESEKAALLANGASIAAAAESREGTSLGVDDDLLKAEMEKMESAMQQAFAREAEAEAALQVLLKEKERYLEIEAK